MQHHTGLSNGFWIYAVKAKLHTYNVTLIKWADYKTPTELWSGTKPNISHLQVFGCQAWVHILKKRRCKLDPKNQEMIFIGYEPGSKGYHFWDAAHQCFEISHDVKFKETLFPAKEVTLKKLNLTPSSDQPISESDNESDNSGLDLVIPPQPPTRPPSPCQSAYCTKASNANPQSLGRSTSFQTPISVSPLNSSCDAASLSLSSKFNTSWYELGASWNICINMLLMLSSEGCVWHAVHSLVG